MIVEKRSTIMTVILIYDKDSCYTSSVLLHPFCLAPTKFETMFMAPPAFQPSEWSLVSRYGTLLHLESS